MYSKPKKGSLSHLGYVVNFFYLLSIKFVQTFPERNMHNPKAT